MKRVLFSAVSALAFFISPVGSGEPACADRNCTARNINKGHRICVKECKGHGDPLANDRAQFLQFYNCVDGCKGRRGCKKDVVHDAWNCCPPPV